MSYGLISQLNFFFIKTGGNKDRIEAYETVIIQKSKNTSKKGVSTNFQQMKY